MAVNVHIEGWVDTLVNIRSNADQYQRGWNSTDEEFVTLDASATNVYACMMGRSINSSTGVVTYLDTQAADITANGEFYGSEYIYHLGDTDTFVRFQDDRVTIDAGSVTMIDMVEGATDYVEINPANADVDFIVNASSVSSAIHMDGATGNVGINMTPIDKFNVFADADGLVATLYGSNNAGTGLRLYVDDTPGSEFVALAGYDGGGAAFVNTLVGHSDTAANALVVDPVNQRVGVMTSPTNATLDVNGTSYFSGHVTFAIASQDYELGDYYEAMSLQGKTAAAAAALLLCTNDGDATDTCSLQVVGLGTPGSLADSHRLIAMWNSGDSQYQIATEWASTGATREQPLVLTTEASGGSYNANQLHLAADGKLGMGKVPSLATLDINGTLAIATVADGGDTETDVLVRTSTGLIESETVSTRLWAGLFVDTNESEVPGHVAIWIATKEIGCAATGVLAFDGSTLRIQDASDTPAIQFENDGASTTTLIEQTSSGDLKITTAAVEITLGDAAGSDYLAIRDSGSAVVFMVDSDGNTQMDGDLEVDGALNHDGSTVGLYNGTPVVQASHIADPSGGATQDAESRTAINSILTALENIGILASA